MCVPSLGQAFFPGVPLIISEVGIPTSLGTSHSGYANRWHGHMTEVQQADVLVEVISYMVEHGAAHWPLFLPPPLFPAVICTHPSGTCPDPLRYCECDRFCGRLCV